MTGTVRGARAHDTPCDVAVDDAVAIGARRLAVIDLDTGRQPIANEDGSIRVVVNGEIYNFADLRTRLERRGHHFRTRSDAEVVVHAYEEAGEDCVRELDGMFALALWDRNARRLLLARDRSGIKPLHYACVGDRMYFGSEIKSILAAGVPREVDVEALDHYLSFLYTPADQSIFRGIRKLPPGHLLEWQDGEVTVSRYWQISAREDFQGSESDAIAGLGNVLRDAVRCHMLSDVPLGAFLSGGVDSSAVVALMAQVSPAPVRTFSIGFDDAAHDELPFARRIAE